MGYEDREYYRESDGNQGGAIPGLRFDRQSIITTLIIINVAIFLLDAFTPRLSAYDMLPNLPDAPTTVVNLGDGHLATVNDLKSIKTETHWLAETLALKVQRPWDIWTYLTHGFAHASITSKIGIFHVGFNMLSLFFLGQFVEQHLGRSEFLKFYLISIIVGGLAWLLIQKLTGVQEASIVGASGAVSAVIVYFIFLMPNARLLLMGIIPVPAWGVGIMFLVSNLYHAMTATQIAWEAHLAGGAFGMAYHLLNWNFSRLQMPNLKRSQLKLHQPAGIDSKLQAEADRILAKISQQGESSLSRAELKTLNKYSKLIRKQRR